MRAQIRTAAVAAAVLAVATLPDADLPGVARAAVPAAARLCHWRVASETVFGSAVAGLSPTNVWVVNGGESGVAKIEHWNGTAWKLTPSPTPSPQAVGVQIGAVLAIADNDLWALGAWQTFNESQGEGPEHTLIEHWTGSKWRIVPSPNPGTGNDVLAGAVAVSASSIWAVGSRQQGTGPTRTLVEHWNGTRWRIVASPNPGTATTSSFLNGVAAGSARQIWAVGGDSLSGGRTLVLHWKGAKWSIAKSGTGHRGALNGVAATSARNAIAVGTISGPGKQQISTLAEQWTGAAWSVVPSPTPADGARLYAVAATDRTNAWAVGSIGFLWKKTLAEHWNGHAWTEVPTPSPSPIDNLLLAVAAVPKAGGFWAVGSSGLNGLVERNC